MWEADLKLWELIAIKLHGMCLMPSWRSGLPNLSESLFQVSDIVLAWLRVDSSHVVKVMLLSPEMTSLPNCLLGMCTQLNAETSSTNWSGQVSAPLLHPSPSNYTTPHSTGLFLHSSFPVLVLCKAWVTSDWTLASHSQIKPIFHSSPSSPWHPDLLSTLSLLFQLC